jgi:diguanylate cyclase (GGDEF)-like protein
MFLFLKIKVKGDYKTMKTKNRSALQNIIFQTSIIVVILTILSFSSIFYVANEKFQQRHDAEVKQVTDIVKETLKTTGNYYTKLERQFDERMLYVSKGIEHDLQGKNVNKLTPAEIKQLSKKWDVDNISLWKWNTEKNNIVVINSSDPNEIGLKSGDWGEWYNIFQDLLNFKKPTYTKGWGTDNYWIGPVSVSDIYLTYFKYPNLSSKDVNGEPYIINPWFKSEQYFEFMYDATPNELMKQITNNNENLEDISVINVIPFVKNENGDKLISDPMTDKPILYGDNKFKLSQDSEMLQLVGKTKENKEVTFNQDGQNLKKVYISLPDNSKGQPQVLTMVTNLKEIESLQLELLIMMLIILTIAVITIYVTMKFVNKKSIKQLENEQERLKIAENFKHTIEILPNAIYKYKYNQDGTFEVIYNEGARAEELNMTTEVSKGKHLEELYSEEYINIVKEAFENVLKGEPAEFIDIVNERVFHNIIKPVYDENKNIIEIAGYATDITERKKVEDKIKHIAYHDNLTDLANRTLFNLRLNESLDELETDKEKLAIMMIDLDNFKKVNDSLGHDIGDLLLIEVADRIKTCLRKHYDLAARMGGDEFTILLPKVSKTEDIDDVAKRIVESLQQPLVIDGTNIMETFKVTASIGIAVAPDNGVDSVTLFKNADIAMYNAKKNGKNNYQFFKNNV